jgi:hypothetical protein
MLPIMKSASVVKRAARESPSCVFQVFVYASKKESIFESLSSIGEIPKTIINPKKNSPAFIR